MGLNISEEVKEGGDKIPIGLNIVAYSPLITASDANIYNGFNIVG